MVGTGGKSQTITVGAWGGSGGSGWDDGSYTGVREIELSYRDAIGSFNEHLVSVSGHYSPLSWLATKTPVIRSLTFKTNKRTFGPYGAEQGTPFTFPIENGVIIGVKGRSGELLDALSFHLSL
ncbi:hypothetical protein TIFTF001_029592 [Ficus carica]|uniref:Jacalin-type lectin domain-containing protein n=1 Tax=Ficus carica TaxID=3494 RepID=A0AA88DRZ6_FICCA|nr:hypothetical protein TIFTF001_029592 [Ficus carica]